MKSNSLDNGYRLEWNMVRQDWPLWVWMVGLLIAGFLLYPILPERVPSHWNIRGEIDAYATRIFGAFFAPLLNIGLYLLMLVLPLVDPRRENYARFVGAYRLIRWGIVLFISGLYLATLMVSLGRGFNVGLGVNIPATRGGDVHFGDSDGCYTHNLLLPGLPSGSLMKTGAIP